MNNPAITQSNGTPYENGAFAEKYVAQRLRRLGYRVREMRHTSPFDLLLDDHLRIEVKYGRPDSAWRWPINFHHAGQVQDSKCDFYVVLLDGIPGNKKMPVYLVIPSPIETPTISFSFSSLVRRYAEYVDNFAILGEPSSVPQIKQPKPRKFKKSA
jgi:hypothetical protein